MNLDLAELPHFLSGACLEVHRELGPGLSAGVYRDCLGRELRMRELFFESNVPLLVQFRQLGASREGESHRYAEGEQEDEGRTDGSHWLGPRMVERLAYHADGPRWIASRPAAVVVSVSELLGRRLRLAGRIVFEVLHRLA